MKKRAFIGALLITSFLIGGCTPKEKEIDPKTFDTIKERLQAIKRIKNIKYLGRTDDFRVVYRFEFDQYIDHNNKKLGTFSQHVEFGFNGFDVPNVYVTSGYSIYDDNFRWSENENEIAFLLKCNYVFVEHRYFDDSLPVAIDYSNAETWKYLTTAQAAADAHDITTELKRALDGKWVSTGISKGGMTTELYAYYYPGDMDLYVPYVAPMCQNFADTRFFDFIYEEAGNLQYGETTAEQMRSNILSFQLKLLEWRDVLAPRYYQDGLDSGTVYSNYLTQDNLYDASVLEFAVCFWQYYQNYGPITSCLNMAESTATQLANKQERFYETFVSLASPADMGINNEFTPYFIQAYQELGNYNYNFSHLRNALPEGITLTVTEQEEPNLLWNLILNESERSIGHKEIMEPKISHMLETTDLEFIILYGSSDPWYSVRPEDHGDRENISIYVNERHPHTTNIQNYPRDVKNEILGKIKAVLGVE